MLIDIGEINFNGNIATCRTNNSVSSAAAAAAAVASDATSEMLQILCIIQSKYMDCFNRLPASAAAGGGAECLSLCLLSLGLPSDFALHMHFMPARASNGELKLM